MRLRVAQEKYWPLVRETEFAARVHCLTGRQLQRVVGHWTWTALACRPMLALFSAVYAFVHADADLHRPRRVWPEVKVARPPPCPPTASPT